MNKLESISKFRESKFDNLNEILGGEVSKSRDDNTNRVYDKNVTNDAEYIVKKVMRAWKSNSGKREVSTFAGNCSASFIDASGVYHPSVIENSIDGNTVIKVM
jgi:hypothetical protein